MKILDLIVGKKIKVMTEVGVPVTLTIKSVKENHHSQDIGPSNAANDWWPETREWTTYTVEFTTGKSKEYSSLDQIELDESK